MQVITVPVPKMAEREGFEPSMEFYPHTPLAGERLRPLGHLSEIELCNFSEPCQNVNEFKHRQHYNR